MITESVQSPQADTPDDKKDNTTASSTANTTPIQRDGGDDATSDAALERGRRMIDAQKAMKDKNQSDEDFDKAAGEDAERWRNEG